jgi:chemotaxis signal transduction protein
MTREYIVFAVASNRYAVGIEAVRRIVNVPPVTPLPDAPEAIEGIFSYEGNVVKVLNLRRVSGLPAYEQELAEAFGTFRSEQAAWVEAVTQAVIEGTPLPGDEERQGMWIGRLTAHDERVHAALQELKRRHAMLHRCGETLLRQCQQSERRRAEALQGELDGHYGATVAALEHLNGLGQVIADGMQRLLIYQNETELIALKVDAIDGIRRVDEASVRYSELDGDGFMDIEGVAEIDGDLVNLIKSVRLPVNEVK